MRCGQHERDVDAVDGHAVGPRSRFRFPRPNGPLVDQLSQLEHLTRAGNTVWTAGWYWNDSGSSGLRGDHALLGRRGLAARPRARASRSAAYSMLFGISGASPDWIWAVGMADDGTYAVLRSGGDWQVVDTPNVVPPDPGLNFLLAVDSSAGVDWAVGYSQAQRRVAADVDHAVPSVSC